MKLNTLYRRMYGESRSYELDIVGYTRHLNTFLPEDKQLSISNVEAGLFYTTDAEFDAWVNKYTTMVNEHLSQKWDIYLRHEYNHIVVWLEYLKGTRGGM